MRAERFSIEQAVGQMMLVTLDGTEVTPAFAEMMRRRHIAGVTMFRGVHIRES